MEQDQQQPSQQTQPIAMAPPPVQPVEPIQPVQPVPPLPSQQELQSAIDLDRRRQRIKTARVLCAIAALLNLIGAVATATLYALTANNHVVTLIVATLLPVVASFFGLSAVGKSRVASSISFFGISIAAVWYFLFGIVILFSPLDSRPDWLMTLLLILDMIALIGGIVVFIMGILSGIFCALAKRVGKRKGIVQLVFVCVILAAAIGVTVYALAFEADTFPAGTATVDMDGDGDMDITDYILQNADPYNQSATDNMEPTHDGTFSRVQIAALKEGMTYTEFVDALDGDFGEDCSPNSDGYVYGFVAVRWVDQSKNYVLALFEDGICTSLGTSEGQSVDDSSSTVNQPTTYSIGDTWTVDGQWSLTITGVRETTERNQFSDKTPGAVYIIDYTYTNLGYEGSIMDLYITLNYETVVDSAGVVGYAYPLPTDRNPDETPIGATCNAQACIGVDNPGPFTLTVEEYDSYYTQHEATFTLTPQ